MEPCPTRAIFNEESVAKDTGVFSVNLRIGTSRSPCVALVGAIESSGVKSTASGYSAIEAALVANGGALTKETIFGDNTVKEVAPVMTAPTVTSSPGSII